MDTKNEDPTESTPQSDRDVAELEAEAKPTESSDTTEAPEASEAPETPKEPVAPAPFVLPIVPQSSHKKRNIIIAVIIVVVLIAVAGVAAYQLANRGSVAANTSQPNTSKSPSPATADNVKSALDALTTGSSDETQLTETDDSKLGDDASASAGTVGDSIDEKAF